MKKTKEQLIADYRKSNKVRRQRIAEIAGFKSGEDYFTNLLFGNKKREPVKKASKKMKGIFHVVDILDATGSMAAWGGASKYDNSKQGIIDGIKDLAGRNDVKYSLIEFIDSVMGLNHAITLQSPKDVNVNKIRFSGPIGSNTPLYKTVYDVVSTTSVGKDDKVLINVYTDGGNNTAYDYQSKCAELIKRVQKENFTITFVATEEDLRRIMQDINIEKSNTLATSNTAEGFAKSMEKTRGARTSYFTSSLAGENTLTGFYKREETL